MKEYLKFTFATPDREAAERLMALLSDTAFYAFEETETGLIAYIQSDDYHQQDFEELLAANGRFEIERIREENWNSKWEADFKPVVIDDFAVIRASFHKPIPNIRYEIIITPKMSFGTGHHATTEMMIRLMKETDFNNQQVIDFGTGTGLLAILAEKCGAMEVYATDNDHWSIENAAENIKNNHCDHIRVTLSDDLSGAPMADVLLANINLNVLLAHDTEVAHCLKIGGLFLFSGILTEDKQRLVDTYEKQGFVLQHCLEKSNWLAGLMKKMK